MPGRTMKQFSSEKYDKIRRQRARTRMVIATVLLVLLVGTFLFVGLRNSPIGAQDSIAKSGTRDSSVHRNASEKKNAVSGPRSNPVVDAVESEGDILKTVSLLDAEVRRLKKAGVIMETDKASQKAVATLQEATRNLLALRYGPNEPYRVEVSLQFQKSIPDFETNGPDGTILLEMAPAKLVPHAVFSFLEVARQWQGGAFHRIAGHVLQVMVNGHFKHLAFQEYSPDYPHKKGTVGYAGRPSGPAWYVSTVDNTKNHGPGSQQTKNPYEADSCFGRVVKGFDHEVKRIANIPDKGFLTDVKKHVLIKRMKILVPGNGPEAVDGYVEWAGAKSAMAVGLT